MVTVNHPAFVTYHINKGYFLRADQRRQEAASRMGGIDLLSDLAASLGKKGPFDDDEEEVEVDETDTEEKEVLPISGK